MANGIKRSASLGEENLKSVHRCFCKYTFFMHGFWKAFGIKNMLIFAIYFPWTFASLLVFMQLLINALPLHACIYLFNLSRLSVLRKEWGFYSIFEVTVVTPRALECWWKLCVSQGQHAFLLVEQQFGGTHWEEEKPLFACLIMKPHFHGFKFI